MSGFSPQEAERLPPQSKIKTFFEPLPSNPIRDPFLLLPGRFDQEQLDPLYSKLFKIQFYIIANQTIKE